MQYLLTHAIFSPASQFAARDAQRGVALCGFGDPEFDKIRIAKSVIRRHFENTHIGEIEMPNDSKFHEHYVVEVTNNYFTRAELVHHDLYMPYLEDEDPYGALDHLYDISSVELVRAHDNDVRYYVEKCTSGDKKEM